MVITGGEASSEMGGRLAAVYDKPAVAEDEGKTVKVRVMNSGYGTDQGMMDANIVGQELDLNMKPILKVTIKDFNLGDPVVAEFRDGGWVVDMD